LSGHQTVLQVVILRDGLLVGTEVFTPGTYALGSAPTSDLRLDDPTIAPRHAILYFQNGRVALQDTGSSTGSYVNGHRISACEIRSADEVLCGPFVLKTRVLSQRPADEQPQPPPEVAALLGGAPPPTAAPVPPRVAPVPPAASQPPVPTQQQLAATQPIARPSGGMPQQLAATQPLARPSGPLRPVPPPEPLAATVPLAPARSTPPAVDSVPVPHTTIPFARPGGAPPPPTSTPAPFHGNAATVTAPEPPTPAFDPGMPPPAGTVPSVKRRAPRRVTPPAPEPAIPDELPVDLSTAPGSAPFHEPAREELPARPERAPRLGPGRGPPQLYLELYWGAVRREARRFAPGRKPVHAAADERAPMPLWGFELPEEPFTLAESVNDAFRLYVPPGVQVERGAGGSLYTPVAPNALEADGNRRFLTLRQGTAARLSRGEMSLVAYPAPLPARVRVNPLAGLPWLALSCFFLLSSALGAFVVTMPSRPPSSDFTPQSIPPVALRLLAPEPKRKEEAQKKLAAIKEKALKRQKPDKNTKTPTPPRPQRETKPLPKAVAAAPQSRALKALAKLSAAGPAANDLLAAVDKLGSGPGSKNAKNSNFKLSGLIGKAPIANAGLGTFGLGGGGKGGGATLGAEILRGKGGGGIGALGAGKVGKGKVGGTVTRATARAIAAQGSIDRNAVAKVVNGHLQEVHACYERALLRDPGLAGKVVLEWTIGAGGRVVAAKTKSSSLKNPSVEACILRNLKKWRFPSPKGGVVIITYPFLFNSVGY